MRHTQYSIPSLSFLSLNRDGVGRDLFDIRPTDSPDSSATLSFPHTLTSFFKTKSLPTFTDLWSCPSSLSFIMSQTEAQEEFQRFVDKNNRDSEDRNTHPEDRAANLREAAASAAIDDSDDLDEEEQHRARQINAAMRTSGSNSFSVQLPPASFDSGRATGVKGVIADARNYETARQMTWKSRVRNARRSIFGSLSFGSISESNMGGASNNIHEKIEKSDSDGDHSQEDEESFLARWRESRRRELENETRSGASVHNRRTSPSVRIYGRLDVVDALGYLDAIEKVGRETVVVVYVYDEECAVSATVEAALRPLVGAYPSVHFVKVHYDDIEFDNAAVPSILAYRNQGDLFANLTGLIEMLPGDDDGVTSEALRKLLHSKGVL